MIFPINLVVNNYPKKFGFIYFTYCLPVNFYRYNISCNPFLWKPYNEFSLRSVTIYLLSAIEKYEQAQYSRDCAYDQYQYH